MVSLNKSHRIFAFFHCAFIILAVADIVENSEDIAKGAVVTNGYTCAHIGASILDKGGSAADAAIASLFCEVVSVPHCMGLGGGFLMTIYTKETGTVETLNARETAPAAATENMFGSDSNLSTKGGLSVAVPGQLMGYWTLHQKYGKLQWKELVQPTIDLCKQGVLVTEYLDRVYSGQFEQIYKDPFLRETFIDPATNQTYKLNERVKMPRFAKTLELIAEQGAEALYNGSLTQDFVKDIQDKGGIITVKDMENYRAIWHKPITIEMPNDQVLYSFPLPGSGVLLGFIIDILNGFLDYSNINSITNWQRIVESFKFGYGRRTELGDADFIDITELIADLTSPEYAINIRKEIYDNQTFQDPKYYGANTTQPDDHGTANLAVLAPNGDAIAVTSTINLEFGAGFMSESTGIILNDEMDDFSSPHFSSEFNIPPSVTNYIKPGKHPLSSMCPSIVVNKDGDVVLAIGAAGGTKITTSVALVTIKNLWFNVTITEAVAEKRFHHQLFPMLIQFEEAYKDDMDLVNALADIGHNYTILGPSVGFEAVTAISREDGVIRTTPDPRRTGDAVLVY